MQTGVVPVFSQTSSPELDQVLATLREQHILPNYLSEAQRELITQEKHIKTLESEPVIANIGGEEFQLKHVNIMTDLKNQRDEFFKALRLMKGKDWENLPRLLEGLDKQPKCVITKNYRNKRRVMNLATAAGRQDIILECVRRADDTGMTITTPMEAHHAMRTMYSVALSSEFDVESTKKALSWSEQLLDQLEEEKHQSRDKQIKRDPRTRPELIGMPLDLAARIASSHPNDADIVGKVEAYAKRALATWDHLRRPEHLAIWDRTLSEEEVPKKMVAFKDQYLAKTVPLLHGLQAAQEVLHGDPEFATQLKEAADELEGLVQSTYKEVVNDPWSQEPDMGREGCTLYEKFYAL
ncbi:hypothetical protein G7Y89_g3805 [Cudoniella acicularis]|uniref:Uncharacterized protein n=1 Tax=Cudoniella acicularis TaxID=354080 RepID=A0A8H4W4V2_9HELO|nr:hypothetical protein G7Y89_g3805 [Cudoniella acicularis]